MATHLCILYRKVNTVRARVLSLNLRLSGGKGSCSGPRNTRPGDWGWRLRLGTGGGGPGGTGREVDVHGKEWVRVRVETQVDRGNRRRTSQRKRGSTDLGTIEVSRRVYSGRVSSEVSGVTEGSAIQGRSVGQRCFRVQC